jgi:hypothetical protein
MAIGQRLRGLAAHRQSHIALRIHQHCNRRFEHFAHIVPRGLAIRYPPPQIGEGYGDTVVTFFEGADNATLDVAAEMFGLPTANLPRNTRSAMTLPIRFRGMGVGTWLAWRMRPMSVRPVSQWALLSVTLKDARVHGDSHDEIPMGPTMYGRLAKAMTTAVSRRCCTPDIDGGKHEQMW